ncbi:MAG: Stp1/IreP family PP2C-type Ser/Thr phosphatase [Rhodocyclaceae bacterium]|nr:Stp1/IreP family PP2C-type Ser/Thr phosphatase [Rhodocyclaceae bacterium]
MDFKTGGFVTNLRIAMATDVGQVRTRNEDAVASDTSGGWALVADGMGGHRGGDVASAIVARVAGECLTGPPAETLDGEQIERRVRDVIRKANRAIFDQSNDNLKLYGMGSTAVLAQAWGKLVTIGHVGDSRAYRLRGGRLERLTVDHSLLQELLDGGMISAAEARRAPGRGVLTRSLGVDPDVDVDVVTVEFAAGDSLLLCSDGLTEMLEDDAILAEIEAADGDLPRATARLIDAANGGGGRDNVSVVLMAY